MAYVMFRFDEEETTTDRMADIIYCYELQVEDSSKSRGAGRVLMDAVNRLSKIWNMEKVMITVFKSECHSSRPRASLTH